MKVPQNISELKQMIADGVEENISLDYKSADALQNTDGKKKEIAKDVSAMANSAGGVIIYGIKEYDSKDKKHFPEKITPISRDIFSKEQLEHIINNNISPKIEGLRIHPVPLSQSNEVAYVVEIPQSNTAHQNTRDHRYYRRYNFEAVAMLDYEIRDIMNREKHPVVELDFEIEKYTYEVKDNFLFPRMPTFPLGGQQMTTSEKKYRTVYTLKIIPVNKGNTYARYINYFIEMPENIADAEDAQYLRRPEPGIIEFYGENTFRDVVDVKSIIPGQPIYKYGPSRFDPVLPGLRGRSEKLKLAEQPVLDNREITWTVHADNAPPNTGSIGLNEVSVIEKIEKEDNDE